MTVRPDVLRLAPSWRYLSLDGVSTRRRNLKDSAQVAARGNAAVDEALSDGKDETLVAEQDRVC